MAEQEKVSVYIYDLSQGMAKQFSQSLLGRHIEGIWHTGIVVFGQEFLFGGGGIESSLPGGSRAGSPTKIIQVGTTSVTSEIFGQWLSGNQLRFAPSSYNLMKHNCNTFTSEASKFLTGVDIPDYIRDLPEEVLNSPMGAQIRPMLENMTGGGGMGGGSGGGGHRPPDANAEDHLKRRPDQATSSQPSKPSKSVSHFPVVESQLVRFEKVKFDVVSDHIQKFNKEMQEHKNSEAHLSAEEISCFKGLVDKLKDSEHRDKLKDLEHRSAVSFTDQEILAISKLLKWPKNKLPPVLNFIRVFILFPNSVSLFQNQKNFVENLLNLIGRVEEDTKTVTVTLRIVVNMISNPKTRQLATENVELIARTLGKCTDHKKKSIRLTFSTLLLNFSIILRNENLPDNEFSLFAVVLDFVVSEEDAAIMYRLWVAMGTLLSNDNHSISVAGDVDITETLITHLGQAKEGSDVHQACSQLLKLVSNAS